MNWQKKKKKLYGWKFWKLEILTGKWNLEYSTKIDSCVSLEYLFDNDSYKSFPTP